MYLQLLTLTELVWFLSNRVNAPITDYKNDSRTASLNEDPTAFIYANKPVELENPGTSIKVLLAVMSIVTMTLERSTLSVTLQKLNHFIIHSLDMIIWI